MNTTQQGQLPSLEQIYEIRKLFAQAYFISDFFMTLMDFVSRKCKSRFSSKLEHWNGFNVNEKNFTMVLSPDMTARSVDEKLIAIYREFLVICFENPDMYHVLRAINHEAALDFYNIMNDVKRDVRPKVTIDFLAQNMINILHIGGGSGNVCRVNLI